MIEAEQAQANSRVINSGFMLEMPRWNNLVEVMPRLAESIAEIVWGFEDTFFPHIKCAVPVILVVVSEVASVSKL